MNKIELNITIDEDEQYRDKFCIVINSEPLYKICLQSRRKYTSWWRSNHDYFCKDTTQLPGVTWFFTEPEIDYIKVEVNKYNEGIQFDNKFNEMIND